MLELPLTLTKDVQAGIQYALFLLEASEQEVLDMKYRLGLPLSGVQLQIEKKALEKLRQPCRWDYMCYGIVGCAKRKAMEAKRKGFTQGYQAGYAAGAKAGNTRSESPNAVALPDLPIETMPLPSRVYNALLGSGCRTIRDITEMDQDQIRRIRRLGTKGIQEIVWVLHSYGIVHTAWELF